MRLITNGFLAWLLTATVSLQPTSLDLEFARLRIAGMRRTGTAMPIALPRSGRMISKWSSRECRR